MKTIAGPFRMCSLFAAQKRDSFYVWRDGLSISGRIALSLFAAALIGVSAQVCIPLPFTPVPLSLQTFAIAASAVALGGVWGILSTIVYVGLAALGMPWLAEGMGGWQVVTGSTFGYIMGFVFVSAALGAFSRSAASRRWLPSWAVMFAANTGLLLLPGTLWLWGWTHWTGHPVDFSQALAMGFLPFVAVDFFKSCAASAIVSRLAKR